MDKPSFLYHASPFCDLGVISPKKNTVPEGFDKGPVVFASHSFAFATQFLVPHDDSWANGGSLGGVFFFVISDEGKYKEADKGGCVYLVDSKYFEKYNKHEWVSEEDAKVISKVTFRSGMEAMIINGVQVYVVNPNIYQKIQTSFDHGAEILNGIKSENERLGLTVEPLELYSGSKKVSSS